jgi:hypothetical protein
MTLTADLLYWLGIVGFAEAWSQRKWTQGPIDRARTMKESGPYTAKTDMQLRCHGLRLIAGDRGLPEGNETMMGSIGCGLSVLAALFALLGIIPFLGWLNWITTLPIAVLAIVFSGLAVSRERENTLAVLGLIGGVLIFFWALFRLALGGGIV